MSMFLGVDGGASATRAVIGDASGHILAYGEGRPSNQVAEEQGRQQLTAALLESAGVACRHLGLSLADVEFEAAFLGFTGGGDDGKRSVVGELVRARQMELSDDAVIAFAGALSGRPGIITAAGTGSVSFGRNEAGQTARAGGWGHAFGGEGGAYDLTRQALRAALKYEEGWGPRTMLHQMLRGVAGLDDIRLAQRKPRPWNFRRQIFSPRSRSHPEAAHTSAKAQAGL